ncbi:MAG: type II toxin-antitoxin system MqsA family antitoxin, partial [Nitrosospira sp.]|nr:type II toxin-antitoxin system MqsA family antitoxin [Nitrosospira sp.]
KKRVCASCGTAGMVLDTRDIPHTYKGRTNVVKGISGHYCPTCGEMELAGTGPDAERLSQEGLAFVKKVNAELADASFISHVRQLLGLTQAEAGKLFGGGHNGFSRYESGRAAPPASLVALFRILETRPNLLDELRQPSPHQRGRASRPEKSATATSG